MQVTVSSPGKIYLSGEHFVVFGRPALLSAIDKRVYVTVSDDGSKRQINSADNFFIRHIIGIVKKHFKINDFPPFRITVKSKIKAGYHLGSSAAVSVAVISSLSYFLRSVWKPDLFNLLAFRAEKIKHGNPSGADNTVSVFGGLIWYSEKGKIIKSIRLSPAVSSQGLNNFYLVDTGRPCQTTGDMVSHVGKFRNENMKYFKRLADINEKETNNVLNYLNSGDIKNLKKAVRAGQQTFKNLGVVSKKVIPFIKDLESEGGAAKILGGGGYMGGVGYLLCLLQNRQVLTQICTKYGFTFQDILLGQPGLRLEKLK